MAKNSSKFHKMLRKENKGQDETRDPLALLYRSVLEELRISPMRWTQLLHEFCNKNKAKIGSSIADYKGNLTKAIVSDKLSWNYFIRSIKIHSPIKIELGIRLTFKVKEEERTVEKWIQLQENLDDDQE